jgi:hypothetical protein
VFSTITKLIAQNARPTNLLETLRMATLIEFADKNINGYSLLAVRATPDSVADSLEKQPDVVSYERTCNIDEITYDRADGVPTHLDGKHLTIFAYPDKRTIALVQPRHSEWSIILRTVDWAEVSDMRWVEAAAKLLASDLNTTAISIAGGFAADLRIFEGTKLAKKKSGDLEKITPLLNEFKIDFPECTIAEDPARIFATKAVQSTIAVAHRVQLSVKTG